MRILCVDTAGAACTAAVSVDGAIVSEQHRAMERGHAEALAPMVERVLSDAGVQAADCDRFVVTTGPGSFTGIRVGVSFVRALAVASGRPAVGVDRFQGFGHTAAQTGASLPVLVVLDSRRGTRFVQPMGGDGTVALEAPEELDVTDVQTRADAATRGAVIGDGVDPVTRLSMRSLALIGARQSDGAAPQPYYLRPPDAKPAAKR